MRHIQMIVSQNGAEVFQGVFDCADLGDLSCAVSDGILAFQKHTKALAKNAMLDALSIELREVGRKD